MVWYKEFIGGLNDGKTPTYLFTGEVTNGKFWTTLLGFNLKPISDLT